MSKPHDFFPYRQGALHAEQVPLERIADEIGTPVYVYSAEALLSPLRELQKGLAGIDHRVCFAVKSNSNLAVLRLLSDAGAGMDLVSGGELYRAGAASVPGERIVFSGVGKTPGEMAQALEYRGSGIFSFNVESVSELEILSLVAQEIGRNARVALRFNPDVNPKTHPYISTGLKKNKFGLSRAEVLDVAKRIGDFPGIELHGLSIHIGSQLLSLKPLGDAFARVRELVHELGRILPAPLEYVDLGGGVGITYKNEKAPSLKSYCALIQKYFGPRAKLPRPMKVLIEPGRRIAGNSGVLLTEVLYRKKRASKDFLIVDAGMNDLIRPALYESYHEIVAVDRAKAAGTKRKTDIVGPVCETGDCFASERPFPAKVAPGDLVAILSAGAYGFTMASNYNSRPRPPEVLVRGGKFEIIRLRETYEDLIRGE
ncbi:MAG: diaminopimelate decarboxylase [Bdellovibrionota bacterium]